MTEQQAVMRQALEALEYSRGALAEELSAWDIDPPLHHVLEAHNMCDKAITALRQALEQQPQEPKEVKQLRVAMRMWDTWKAEAFRLAERLRKYEKGAGMILNTADSALEQQPAVSDERTNDEPVACVCYGISSDGKHCLDYEQSEIDAVPVGTMLYTRPQPADDYKALYEQMCECCDVLDKKLVDIEQHWVGLTDEEIDGLFKNTFKGRTMVNRIARAIEFKLKEKNT